MERDEDAGIAIDDRPNADDFKFLVIQTERARAWARLTLLQSYSPTPAAPPANIILIVDLVS